MKNCLLAITSMVLFMSCSSPKVDPLLDLDKATSGNNAVDCQWRFTQNDLCANFVLQSSSNQEFTFNLYFWHPSNSNILIEPTGESPIIKFIDVLSGNEAPQAIISKKGIGEYRVLQTYPLDAGFWDIKIQLQKNQQLIDESSRRFRF